MTHPKDFRFKKVPIEVWNDKSKSPFDKATQKKWSDPMNRLFGDKDKDGIMNVFDKDTKKKRKIKI